MGCLGEFIAEVLIEVVFQGFADLMEDAYGNTVVSIINLLLLIAGIILIILGVTDSLIGMIISGVVCLSIFFLLFIVAVILRFIKKG